MRASELRELGSEELQGQLKRMRERLYQLRSEFHTDEEPDTTEKSKLRRDIARILTIFREREVGDDKATDSEGAT